MDVSCMNTVHVDILNVDYNVLFFFFLVYEKAGNMADKASNAAQSAKESCQEVQRFY